MRFCNFALRVSFFIVTISALFSARASCFTRQTLPLRGRRPWCGSKHRQTRELPTLQVVDSNTKEEEKTRERTQHDVKVISSKQQGGGDKSGFAHWLLERALDSPLWQYVLVPQAKSKMLKTAEANGIPWSKCLQWIENHPNGPWNIDDSKNFEYPTYYTKPFHAYESGNLCWQSAFEQEIAGRAVGARNFPLFKDDGDIAFRDAFDLAFEKMNVHDVPNTEDCVIVDLGCGTGLSTRRLAQKWPNCKQIVGIDMSPYFIKVGQFLLKETPRCYQEDGGKWVNSVVQDDRIILQVGDATDTGLLDNYADVVSIQFLFHELPIDITKQVIHEAYRILKPGGQLLIGEMDFQSPAYAAQRSNALLFSLIRSTEPYLDEYADNFDSILKELLNHFNTIEITAATGRHYAIRALKSSKDNKATEDKKFVDKRFNDDGSYAIEDTHLQVWEDKK